MTRIIKSIEEMGFVRRAPRSQGPGVRTLPGLGGQSANAALQHLLTRAESTLEGRDVDDSIREIEVKLFSYHKPRSTPRRPLSMFCSEVFT